MLGEILDDLLISASTGPCITASRHFPARPPVYAPFPQSMDPRIVEALRARGIAQLYSHQARAWELVQAGRHVVLVTPTASGKTLCYNLPVLQALVHRPDARALYVFPTKALAQDQLAELEQLAKQLPEMRMFTYDGDTPQDARRAVRARANLVLTNPDMLHSGILPHHTKWAALFQNLEYVVIAGRPIWAKPPRSPSACCTRRSPPSSSRRAGCPPRSCSPPSRPVWPTAPPGIPAWCAATAAATCRIAAARSNPRCAPATFSAWSRPMRSSSAWTSGISTWRSSPVTPAPSRRSGSRPAAPGAALGRRPPFSSPRARRWTSSWSRIPTICSARRPSTRGSTPTTRSSSPTISSAPRSSSRSSPTSLSAAPTSASSPPRSRTRACCTVRASAITGRPKRITPTTSRCARY